MTDNQYAKIRAAILAEIWKDIDSDERGQVEPEDLTDAIMAILEKGLADD